MRLLRYLWRLNLREPIAFVYNLLFPLAAFALWLMVQEDNGLESGVREEVLYQVCAYMILSGSLYGVGITFIYWREAGFFLTFCKSRESVGRLLRGQLFLRALFCAFFVSCVIVMFAVFTQSWSWMLFARMLGWSWLLSLLIGWASNILMVLRVQPADLTPAINALMFIMILLNAFAIHSETSGLAAWMVEILNGLNPLNLITRVLQLGGREWLAVVEGGWLGLQLIACWILGELGLRHISRHPIALRL